MPTPVFDPERLHALTAGVVGRPLPEMLTALVAELAREYPGHVDPGPPRWIFNNAGGAMGQIHLLYASLTEYVLLFGTPIGTEGHSGRYRTDVHDFVFDGEFWCYLEGDTERRVYGPGSAAFLGPADAKGYRIPSHCWMLEYSRGFIPSMLPFGLADTLLSTLDTRALRRTVGAYARHTTRNLLRGRV